MPLARRIEDEARHCRPRADAACAARSWTRTRRGRRSCVPPARSSPSGGHGPRAPPFAHSAAAGMCAREAQRAALAVREVRAAHMRRGDELRAADALLDARTASRRSAARPTRRSPDVLTVSRMRAGGPWTRRWHVPSTGASSTACPSIRRRRRDRSTFMRAYQTLISPAGGRGPSSGLGVAGHTDMYTTPGTIGMATAESLPESQQRGVEGRRRVRKTQDELKTSRPPSTGPETRQPASLHLRGRRGEAQRLRRLRRRRRRRARRQRRRGADAQAADGAWLTDDHTSGPTASPPPAAKTPASLPPSRPPASAPAPPRRLRPRARARAA